MLLFNQTKNQLRWSMSGIAYGAAPLGVVQPEVPDALLYAVERRGLPVDAAPITEPTEQPRAEAPKPEKPKSKPRAE